jgi:hypothetical protein
LSRVGAALDAIDKHETGKVRIAAPKDRIKIGWHTLLALQSMSGHPPDGVHYEVGYFQCRGACALREEAVFHGDLPSFLLKSKCTETFYNQRVCTLGCFEHQRTRASLRAG